MRGDFVVATEEGFGPWEDRLGAEVRLLAGPPANAERLLSWPGPTERISGDGQVIEVTPPGQAPWLGMYDPGIRGTPSAARFVACPQPGRAILAYLGEAYLLTLADRHACEAVPVANAHEIWTSESRELLLVFGDFDMCAYGLQGLLWVTHRFALDGYEAQGLDGNRVVGLASTHEDGCEAMRPFNVDLGDGSVLGGEER